MTNWFVLGQVTCRLQYHDDVRATRVFSGSCSHWLIQTAAWCKYTNGWMDWWGERMNGAQFIYREEKRWLRVWLWEVKGPHVIFHLFMSFSFCFLLFFCTSVDVECFNACTPKDTKPLQSTVCLPPSLYHCDHPLSPSLQNISLQALATLRDEIIPIFTVPLHRMTIIYLQGVDRAVDQYQLLTDLLASCWEFWLSYSTLWSALCGRTTTCTHISLITLLIPQPGLYM